MVWFSYHGGHSGAFCRHAKDSLAQVVERAIEAGFTHYGLSEHCPRYRAEDLFADEADLTPADLIATFRKYVDEAFEVRERFADRIQVVVGFETERLPPDTWLTRMHELRASAPFEYVIGSVHDVDGVVIDYKAEDNDALAAKLGGRAILQSKYFDAITDMASQLKPEVVGHIDLIRKFDGPSASIAPESWPHLEAALNAVRDAGSVLDINCGAFRRGLSPVYPLPEILKLACTMGIGVTLGDDSHGISSVGVGLDACMRVIADAGYKEVAYFTREEGATVRKSAKLEDVKPR